MKKILLVILALVMVFSLVACDNNGSQSGKDPVGSGDTSTPGNTSTPGGDKEELKPYEVTFHYTCWWTQPTDEGTAGVEQAINARLAELGLPYTLKIKWISLFEYTTQIDLILASGEKTDIIFCDGLSNMINNGYVEPLDEYLDNELSETVELLGNWLECGKSEGVTYAIPCHKGLVLTYCYNYNKELVDAVGYDMSQIEDFFDIEPLFAELKAAYPNMICDVDGSRYPDIVAQLTKTAVLGTYGATVGDDTTVYNRFETDAWLTALDYAYRFRNLGYVSPDGSTNPDSSAMYNEKQLGIIIAFGSDAATQAESYTTRQEIPMDAIAVCTQNLSTTGILWGVSYTSENVAAAATLLNLMWTDYYVLNALIYGVEGRDYVMVEETTGFAPDQIGSMDYPEGMASDTVPYNMGLNSGIFGDEFLMLRGSTMSSDTRKYMQDVIDNAWVTPTFGFTPSTNDISAVSAAVSNVYNQYSNSLIFGDVDPDEYNPIFLDALKTAGIDEIIDSYQTQLDAWLAAK